MIGKYKFPRLLDQRGVMAIGTSLSQQGSGRSVSTSQLLNTVEKRDHLTLAIRGNPAARVKKKNPDSSVQF